MALKLFIAFIADIISMIPFECQLLLLYVHVMCDL